MPSTRLSPASLPVRLTALTAFAVLQLTGCQGTVGQLVPERFDENTGITYWSASRPMVFARQAGQYSRSARDYAYVGPVETNRQGIREYYLWVGVGSTLDRDYLALSREVPNALFIVTKGELMELKLMPWASGMPGLDAGHAYDTRVGLDSELVARVTRDQLELLAGEPTNTLLFGRDDGRPDRYELWRSSGAWDDFLQHISEIAPAASARSTAR
jgi:hypothetical protein